MLELNPNDNQGVRDPLLGLYLTAGDLKGAGRLLKKYEDDALANFAWGRVLERFLAGDRAGAKAALEIARAANGHVELYMTIRKPLPEEAPVITMATGKACQTMGKVKSHGRTRPQFSCLSQS